MHWKKQTPSYGTIKLGRKFCILPETWGEHRVWLKSIPTISCYNSSKYDFASSGDDYWSEVSLRDYLDDLKSFLRMHYDSRVALPPEDRITHVLSILSKKVPNYLDFFVINMHLDKDLHLVIDIKVTNRQCSTKEQLIWSLRNPIESIPVVF